MSYDRRSSPYRTARLALGIALGALAIFALPGIAAAKDRNNDRIPDRWEKRHNLSLKVKQTRRDQDGDHLRNLGEFHRGTNPHRADSDRDGIRDGREAALGDDPADRDSDNDGVGDGDENAGTVASFDGTTLIIDLAAGGTASGLVDDRTEIECEDHGEHRHRDHHRASRDHGGEGRSGGGDGEHGGQQGEGGHHGEDGDDEGHHGDDGDDDREHGEHGNRDEACSVDDLVAGALVHEAEIKVTGDGAVFEKVELIKSQDSTG